VTLQTSPGVDIEIPERALSHFPRAADAGGSIFCEPIAGMDDETLLAWFRSPRGVWFAPVPDAEETRPEKIAGILAGRFEFNSEAHELTAPIDWLVNPSRDVEWHILLHKFYYAVGLGMGWQQSRDARYVQRWIELIDGWMAQCPLDFIATDVTGRRVQNWIYSLHHFVVADAAAPVPAAFLRRLLASIHAQVDHLRHHLTPKRNHRTLELYTVFLAGVVFPEMRASADWRAFALEQIVANMREDLLPDGVQCELSTDYHHLVLKNYLNVRRLAERNRIAVPPEMDAALNRALDFALHAHKPDGIVPSLSDGDARGFLELLAYGAELFGRDDLRWVASGGREGRAPADRCAHFPASGYSIVRSHWGEHAGAGGEPYDQAQYLILDCGAVGEGNHGHFDCLSFELAAFGRSLVVDPGRYTYSEAGETNWRVHFRGTAAHNTVTVDARNQTRYVPKAVKPGTRHASGTVRHKISGPPPDARTLQRLHADTLDLLHGEARSHEYDAVHQRRVLFVDRRYWIISDRLDAPTAHDYVQRFQLGEAAQGQVQVIDTPAMRGAVTPGLTLLQPVRCAAAALEVAPAWVSYRYGEKLPAPQLRFATRADRAVFDAVLLPWREAEAAPPALQVADLAVHDARGQAAAAGSVAAMTISLPGEGTDLWLHAAAPGAWMAGDVQFEGSWLLLRRAADGQPIEAWADAGATLRVADRPVVIKTGAA
jgi:hypothetical protein